MAKNNQFCYMCGKSVNEVNKLIKGEYGYICDSCISIARIYQKNLISVQKHYRKSRILKLMKDVLKIGQRLINSGQNQLM